MSVVHEFKVEMTCTGCSGAVERVLAKLGGSNSPTTSTRRDNIKGYDEDMSEVESDPLEVKTEPNKKKRCNCHAELQKFMEDKFSKLTEEVANLRKEVENLKNTGKEVPARSCLVSVPFETKESFLKFEEEIRSNPEKLIELKSSFLQGKYKDPKKFIRINLSQIMTDDVAEQFSWRGTKDKKSIRDSSITAALKDAFRIRYTDTAEEVFDETTKRHFQYAKDRQTKRGEYEERVRVKSESIS